MPLQISYHLATVLLIETLRVGAAVLLIAGAALVGGSILTEYHGKEPREGEGDPYVGFGFIGAVGLGAGAMLSSIPLWIAYRAIRTWHRATAPRDIRYPWPLVATEGREVTITPRIEDTGSPPAQFITVMGRLPTGMKIDKRTGTMSGTPRLSSRDFVTSAVYRSEVEFRITVEAQNLKGRCHTSILLKVRRSAEDTQDAGGSLSTPPAGLGAGGGGSLAQLAVGASTAVPGQSIRAQRGVLEGSEGMGDLVANLEPNAPGASSPRAHVLSSGLEDLRGEAIQAGETLRGVDV